MANEERIVRYTAAEIDEMIRRGEDKTDWGRIDGLAEEELEASIDVEDEGEFDDSIVWAGVPGPGQHVYVELDQEVAAWFKSQGPGYPARINAALRGYVEAQRSQRARQLEDAGEPATRR